MSNYLVDGADLTSVADAIRTKGGTSAQLAFPQGFVDAVEAIETGIEPTGTKQITITENGTTTEDVANYANAEITVNVPASGWETVAIARNQAPNGRIAFNDAITIEQGALSRKPITSLFAPNARISNTAFGWCTSLKTAVFKDFTSTTQFSGCTALEAVDLRGSLTVQSFNGCTKLATVVIRATSVVSLSNINAFNNTPFASGKAGGTLYVPQALIASYQAATNWSTILGYANNQILQIEGSIYETQYVDGTPIPTT